MGFKDFVTAAVELSLFIIAGCLFIFFAAIIWSLVTAAFVCTL